MEKEFSINLVLDKRREKDNGLYPVKLWVYSTASQTAKRYPTKFSFSDSDFNSIWKNQRSRSIRSDYPERVGA